MAKGACAAKGACEAKGACAVKWGMHGNGVCMAKEVHALQRDMHGRGVWCWACMVGGHAWQGGICDKGACVARVTCMAGETPLVLNGVKTFT